MQDNSITVDGKEDDRRSTERVGGVSQDGEAMDRDNEHTLSGGGGADRDARQKDEPVLDRYTPLVRINYIGGTRGGRVHARHTPTKYYNDIGYTKRG